MINSGLVGQKTFRPNLLKKHNRFAKKKKNQKSAKISAATRSPERMAPSIYPVQ
jgi:hypothetical protein